MLINVVDESSNMFRKLGNDPLTLVGSSPKLGGDSRRNNTCHTKSVGWVESRSRAFSRINLLT